MRSESTAAMVRRKLVPPYVLPFCRIIGLCFSAQLASLWSWCRVLHLLQFTNGDYG